MLLTSEGTDQRMPLNILQCIGQSPPQKDFLVLNSSSAKVTNSALEVGMEKRP